MKRRQVGVALLVATVLQYCPTLAMNQPPIARGLSNTSSAVIQTWLDCEECTRDQLAAVAALGDTAVPALNNLLRTGPPQPAVDARRAFLETRWQKMQSYAAAHPEQPVPQARAKYVEGYVRRYVLLNRMRAARALGAINTAAAQNALQQALQLPNVPDALRKEINTWLPRP
jgi:hypothetical protein